MTESEIVAKAVEVDPAFVRLVSGPGQMQTGHDMAVMLAALGHKVKFLHWPGGIGGAVAYLATRAEPTPQQIVQAYRDAVEVELMLVNAEGGTA